MHPETKASIANVAYVRWDARRAALAAAKNPDDKLNGVRYPE
jgi:hypothetical protein